MDALFRSFRTLGSILLNIFFNSLLCVSKDPYVVRYSYKNLFLKCRKSGSRELYLKEDYFGRSKLLLQMVCTQEKPFLERGKAINRGHLYQILLVRYDPGLDQNNTNGCEQYPYVYLQPMTISIKFGIFSLESMLQSYRTD